MADYIVQQDGVSKITLEDGSGALLLEAQGAVAVVFNKVVYRGRTRRLKARKQTV